MSAAYTSLIERLCDDANVPAHGYTHAGQLPPLSRADLVAALEHDAADALQEFDLDEPEVIRLLRQRGVDASTALGLHLMRQLEYSVRQYLFGEALLELNARAEDARQDAQPSRFTDDRGAESRTEFCSFSEPAF